jgi:hypothetical protein
MPALDPVMPVEPVGTLIPVAPVAPGIPSGDTAPSAGAAGAVDMVCAAATPQLNSTATAAADNLRIEILRSAVARHKDAHAIVLLH